MLACITNTVSNKTRAVAVLLFAVLVRPHFKPCVHFWASHNKTEIEGLEHDHSRAMELGKGLEYKPC